MSNLNNKEKSNILDKYYDLHINLLNLGDTENSNSDSDLVSTKRCLVASEVFKDLYYNYFLKDKEKEAVDDGYIYIHDRNFRLSSMNCCLFDIGTVLNNGFELGNIWYNKPKTLKSAMSVISDLVLACASQQYGGFTLPEIDSVLVPYCEETFELQRIKYEKMGVSKNRAIKEAMKDVETDLRQGIQGWEYKFNTVASSRGDYPFITISFGLSTNKFGKLVSHYLLDVRKKGQGAEGKKRPVLFPKLVFLYDKNLHKEGKELYDLFLEAIDCSSKCMYPDFLSLTGDSYVSDIYKKYGRVISPMGCFSYDTLIELDSGNQKGGEVVEILNHIMDEKDEINKFIQEDFTEFLMEIEEEKNIKIKLVKQDNNTIKVYVFNKGKYKLLLKDISFLNEIKVNETLRSKFFDLPHDKVKIKCNDEFVSLNTLLYNVAISNWLKITYKIGENLNYVELTEDHPLPLISGEVKQAQELKIGDKLINIQNNSNCEATVINIEKIEKCCRSYDVSTDTEYFNINNDILSHNCRAYLSPWYEKGGMYQEDEDDKPVYIGRFNIGAISLNLPMILQKSRVENKNFYEVLDYYLEMIRDIHKRTLEYLGKLKANINPVAFCYGGFYGGHLSYNDEIAPVLKSTTASFGITALNELQRLFNGNSIKEDGDFAYEVMQYINKKIAKFKKEDNYLYAIYGTPGESMIPLQVKQFRKKYGVIKNVSDRDYFSNSFHCHVSEHITPIEKQDYEKRFYDTMSGGQIQYCKYPINYNLKAIQALIERAMELGFYEGVNLDLSYCNSCGHEQLDMEVCPKCNSTDIVKVNRMNGYLSYSRIKGKSRLNDGKMIEIKERVSM